MQILCYKERLFCYAMRTCTYYIFQLHTRSCVRSYSVEDSTKAASHFKHNEKLVPSTSTTHNSMAVPKSLRKTSSANTCPTYGDCKPKITPKLKAEAKVSLRFSEISSFYCASIRSLSLGAPFWYVFSILVTLSLLPT